MFNPTTARTGRLKYLHRANAHWRGMKADSWEAGRRMPFPAKWPAKVRAGSVSSQLGCLTGVIAPLAGEARG